MLMRIASGVYTFNGVPVRLIAGSLSCASLDDRTDHALDILDSN